MAVKELAVLQALQLAVVHHARALSSTLPAGLPTGPPTGLPAGLPTSPPTGPTLDLPCCYSSAQNATTLGPVVVLRRDDEKPSAMMVDLGATPGAPADPTWEVTLRRAASRALTWGGLSDAPFVASHHSESTVRNLVVN